MKDQITIKMLENIISETKAFIERIENAKIKYSLVSHGFVVWNPVAGMPLSFTFKELPNGRKQATGGGVAGILFAEHYTKADATALAADTLCGPKKVPAVPMFINDAIDLTIAEQSELVATLETHVAELESHLAA